MKPPVLLLRLRPWPEAEWQRKAGQIRAAHPEAALFLLTAPEGARSAPSGVFDETWQDGAPHGAFALLALMRRLSWASFAAIYDGEGTRRTGLYRRLVRPPPPWRGLPD